MAQFVGLVIKDNLKGGQRIHDVLVIEAPSYRSALQAISQTRWEDDLWVEGKSTVRVMKLFSLDDVPASSRVVVRRRRRSRSGPQSPSPAGSDAPRRRRKATR